MITAYAKIQLHKEDMKFSAAHFTIFSANERENLHGHNYFVHASFMTQKSKDGLVFDYRFYKNILRRICSSLDEIVILPALSPHLKITESATHFSVMFNQEEMKLLKRDVLLLPITNVTVEALSDWIIKEITKEEDHLIKNQISSIQIKIYSGPGQSGSSSWIL